MLSLAYIQAEFLNKLHNVLSNFLKFVNKVNFFVLLKQNILIESFFSATAAAFTAQ